MAIGALKTLMTMLAEAPSMVGVSLAFGEENKIAQEHLLPYCCVVPIGGPWQQSGAYGGYYVDATNEQDNVWATTESLALYLWAADDDVNALPVDHADAVEELRAKVLQALQNQAPLGLMFRPISGQWALGADSVVRYGRAYILTVSVDIAIPAIQPVEVTLESVEVTVTVEGA